MDIELMHIRTDKKLVAAVVVASGLSDKQSSGDSYQSAESGRYVTAASGGRSPTASRSITPEPSDGIAKAADIVAKSTFDPRKTNLDHFHGEARFQQQISEGQFTKIRGLSACCQSDGKVELHCWSKTDAEDLTVVVKRVVTSRVGNNVGKESNERFVHRGHCQRHAEDCLNEIGVYCYLSRQRDLPQYILKMHTVFQGSSDVWLVLEHANEGDLFAVAQSVKREGKSVSAGQLMSWCWQLLQAVHYLHMHRIGHRDISMENVLLKDGHVCLMDFGQAVQTHTADGVVLRYFNALGKPYYRPPECHCPNEKIVNVHVPQGARPGGVAFARTTTGDNMIEVLLPHTAAPGQISAAEPWGYAVTPVDMFACGVCMFIMATGMPPWKQANLGDPHFAWVHQCGISQLLKAWKKVMPAAADELMTSLVQSEPAKRPTVEQCLEHSWFSQIRGTPVPIHVPCRAASTSFDSTTSAAVAEIAAASTATYAKTEFELPGSPFLRSSAFACDPYTQEASVRNVEAPASASPSASRAVPEGDFYSLPEDTICRSVFPAELSLQRFTATHLPPKAPVHESFWFEPTTLYFSDKQPAEVGNQLLDFLTMAAGAVVNKIGMKKFSIKAIVNGEDGACTLKVRIYDQGEGKCAVEFQRREGDSAAFHKVFDQASEHLGVPVQSPASCELEIASTVIKQVAPTVTVAQANANGAPINSYLSAVEVFANRTWPAPHTRTKAPSAPSGQRTRGRPGRSVPALTKSFTTESSKVAAAEALENLALTQINPVGSGFNAVRKWRSKSTLRRPSNVHTPTPLALNMTM